MARQVTTGEAAALLGVSRRTVERRVKARQLATVTVAGMRLVELPDEVLDATDRDMSPATPDSDMSPNDATDRDIAGALAGVRAELAAATAERDYLRGVVNRLLDSQQQLLAGRPAPPSLTFGPEPPGPAQPAPGARTPPPSRRRRRWWPWRR